MRSRLLIAIMIAGAVLGVSCAAAVTVSRDTTAVRKELARARTLQAALQTLVPSAGGEISHQLTECRAIQPSGEAKQRRLSTLIGLERVRQLQHIGLADYEQFVKAVQGLRLTNARLLNAQRALAAELAALRKLTNVPIRACDDLKDFAKAGYTDAALASWAKGVDRKAGISHEQAQATDKLVLASRPALVGAGLTPAQATIVLNAGTSDVFLYAGLRATPA